jgi:hypothetical protein
MSVKTGLVLVAIVLAATLATIPMIFTFVHATENRCVSERTDTGATGRECLPKDAPDSQQIMKEQKQICREVVDKCSSSQTGFGSFPPPK